MEFKFEGRLKLVTQVLMAVGVIALVGGFLTDHSDHHQRFWANLLINGFFYFTMALAALFFYALQYATESGWSAVLKRWFEALWGFLPWGAAVIVIVLWPGKLHLHHLYHWMDHSLYHEYMVEHGDHFHYVDEMEEGAVLNPNYDHVIAGKAAYFADWFFWLRTAVYIGTFLIFARLFRKWSLQEDEAPNLTFTTSNTAAGRCSWCSSPCSAPPWRGTGSCPSTPTGSARCLDGTSSAACGSVS